MFEWEKNDLDKALIVGNGCSGDYPEHTFLIPPNLIDAPQIEIAQAL